jgi:DNA polymerase
MPRKANTVAKRSSYDGCASRPEPALKVRKLLHAVHNCSACPGMGGLGGILQVVGRRIRRSTMFVAEAPGRLGAVRTRLPLSGDATGQNFENLLAEAGWTRRDVWITNAVLCWPGSLQGLNRRPSTAELQSCSHFLAEQLSLVQPSVVVPLGLAALAALHLVSPIPSIVLRTAVGRPHDWYGRFLFPLYHPSPRVVNTRRSLVKQRADFRVLRRFVDSIE